MGQYWRLYRERARFDHELHAGQAANSLPDREFVDNPGECTIMRRRCHYRMHILSSVGVGQYRRLCRQYQWYGSGNRMPDGLYHAGRWGLCSKSTNDSLRDDMGAVEHGHQLPE
jgi:hypothetical protein